MNGRAWGLPKGVAGLFQTVMGLGVCQGVGHGHTIARSRQWRKR